ncbi:MAG: hypothetical protein LBR78_00355 [Holosporales bacterium]|nr:hypothetical protein [Holosporales bacterium]
MKIAILRFLVIVAGTMTVFGYAANSGEIRPTNEEADGMNQILMRFRDLGEQGSPRHRGRARSRGSETGLISVRKWKGFRLVPGLKDALAGIMGRAKAGQFIAGNKTMVTEEEAAALHKLEGKVLGAE